VPRAIRQGKTAVAQPPEGVGVAYHQLGLQAQQAGLQVLHLVLVLRAQRVHIVLQLGPVAQQRQVLAF
jgi:hypothetical protein